MRRRAWAGVVLAALAASRGSVAWGADGGAAWLEGWSDRKAMTVPADLAAEELIDFPLLVVSTGDADVASKARGDGADLAFTRDDGATRLGAELEAFDGATGAWRAWVRVPRLVAAQPTRLFVYFGNPSARAGPGQEAWRDDFVAVWHMDDDPATARCEDGATGAVCDSSRNRRHGVAPAMDAGNLAPGQIGAALRFDGSTTRVTYPCEGCPGYPYSISVWFQGSAGVLVAYQTGLSRSIALTGAFLHAGDRVGTALARLPADAWHQVVAVYASARDVRVFTDGVETTEATDDWWNAAGASSPWRWRRPGGLPRRTG